MKKKSPIFSHVSRNEKTYYIHQRISETGKISYYLSPNQKGNLVEMLPEGYEVYDHPSADQCFLRPIQPRLILEKEEQEITHNMKKDSDIKHYRVDIQKNTLVLYTPGEQKPFSDVFAKLFKTTVDPKLDKLPALLRAILPGMPLEREERFLKYHPMLRFTLIDEEKRIFAAERWCVLGGIEEWLNLNTTGNLPKLCRALFPHLDKESFYELGM